MSTKYSENKIHDFIRSFVKSKEGELIEQSDQIFTVKYPNQTNATEYTYSPAIAREKKAVLVTLGSTTFQQILDECLHNGVPCQINVDFKEEFEFETLIKNQFKDLPFACQDCTKVAIKEEIVNFCKGPQLCYHQINNGKIVSIKVIKKEPCRYFQFYFSATFRNKLRPRNEEIITVLIGEAGNILDSEDSSGLLDNEELEIKDLTSTVKPIVFDELKAVAYKKLEPLLKEKLTLFDLPLIKEKEAKLKSFDKRIRRDRLEHAINNKYDIDPQKWQASHDAFLKREEESLTTHIAVKFINLLIINTKKVGFEIKLDNNAIIHSSFILGINHNPEVICPICRNAFSDGYATQDSLYVCRSCIRQSIDTAKIHSKKAALKLDETLNEYFEQDEGFICSVCGRKHSRLLEFKCNHDNSSVCIFHYDFCDLCGKIFSKLNLISTHEFTRKLCPRHTVKCEDCQSIIGVDEIKVRKSTGERICNNCMDKSKER